MLLGSRNYRIRDRRGKTALAALSEALTGFSLAAAIALALSSGQPWAESIFTNSRGLYLHTPIAGHLPLPATQATRVADDTPKPPSQETAPAAGAENKPV